MHLVSAEASMLARKPVLRFRRPPSVNRNMNTKVEQQSRMSATDMGLLTLAVIVVVGSIYGYYQFSEISGTVRMLGVLVGVAAGLGIAAFTAPGRAAREYIKESQFELRKVVWPTREETIRTTIVIMIVVVIVSLLLGLIDLVLKWGILDTLLSMKG